MQRFYEVLGPATYLLAAVRRRPLWYWKMAPITVAINTIATRLRLVPADPGYLRQFGWGDTEFLGRTVSVAAGNAKLYLPCLESVWEMFESDAGRSRGPDIALIVKKYVLVEMLYRKYFFYELLLRFIEENRSERIELYAEPLHADPYRRTFSSKKIAVAWSSSFPLLRAILSLVVLSATSSRFWVGSIRRGSPTIEAELVCNAESLKMIAGFRELFRDLASTEYVVPVEYASNFATAGAGTQPVLLGLSNAALIELDEIRRKLRNMATSNLRLLTTCGIDLVALFKRIVDGRARVPEGRYTAFLSCEHHDLGKTIRNEFLRSRGVRSVLFPYSSLHVLQYHADEYYENYEIILSPGRYYEDSLRQNESRATDVEPVGTYLIHRDGLSVSNEQSAEKLDPGDLRERTERIDRIRRFAGSDKLVTVLCPGVCKPTFHSEVKLMRLAVELSRCEGVKVVVRQKPFIPEAAYADFYQEFVKGNDRIWLTGMEFELFDFLPATDLFVTTYSTSACEVAVCGARVIFVDVIRQDDRFIFWQGEFRDHLLVDEPGSLIRIGALIRREEPVWTQYLSALTRFAQYLGYTFQSYEDYKQNLSRIIASKVLCRPPASGGARFGYQQCR